MNWVIPVVAAFVSSMIMISSSAKYVEKHYKIKKKKDSNEIEVEVI